MVFANVQKAREWFLDYKPLTEVVPMMYKDNIDFKPIIGDWFLFRHIKPIDSWSGPEVISRPILAIFIDWDVWDQALVIRYQQGRRAWESSQQYETEHDGKKYQWKMFHQTLEVEDIQFWTDDIQILGHWKRKPTITLLKNALKTPQ